MLLDYLFLSPYTRKPPLTPLHLQGYKILNQNYDFYDSRFHQLLKSLNPNWYFANNLLQIRVNPAQLNQLRGSNLGNLLWNTLACQIWNIVVDATDWDSFFWARPYRQEYLKLIWDIYNLIKRFCEIPSYIQCAKTLLFCFITVVNILHSDPDQVFIVIAQFQDLVLGLCQEHDSEFDQTRAETLQYEACRMAHIQGHNHPDILQLNQWGNEYLTTPSVVRRLVEIDIINFLLNFNMQWDLISTYDYNFGNFITFTITYMKLTSRLICLQFLTIKMTL